MRDPDASVPDGSQTNALDEHADARLEVAQRSGSGEGGSSDLNGRRIEVRAGDDPSERMRDLLAGASRWLGLPVADICSANRGRVFAKARAVVAYLAVEELGLSGQTTAATLGISASAVSHALRHGKAVVREERLRIVEAGSPRPD